MVLPTLNCALAELKKFRVLSVGWLNQDWEALDSELPYIGPSPPSSHVHCSHALIEYATACCIIKTLQLNVIHRTSQYKELSVKYFIGLQSNHIFLKFNSLNDHKLAVIGNVMQFYLAKVLNCLDAPKQSKS